MIEITWHPAYAVIEDCRERGVVVDYVVLDGQGAGGGKEAHRKAAVAGMEVIAERRDRYADAVMAANPQYRRTDFLRVEWYPDSLGGSPYPSSSLFAPPTDPFYIERKHGPEVRVIDWDDEARYAYAFLEPPYTCTCLRKDWERVNSLLFPSPDSVEIYSWSTNWSNYFDEGLEWWGAYYWTVCDSPRDTYVVIGASATD